MIHSQGSIVIDHPVDEVFAYLTSPEHYKTVGKFPDGGPITGLMEVEVAQENGQQTKQRLKRSAAVTAYEPDRAIAFRVTTSGWVSSSMSYRYALEPVEEGARVALDIDLTVQGWIRLFSGLLRLLFKRGVEIELDTLKGKLEARPTGASTSNADTQSVKPPQETGAIDASIALAKQEPDQAPQHTSSLWALLMRMQPLDLIRLPDVAPRWPQFLAVLYTLSALALFGWEISTFWENWQNDQWQIFSFAFVSLSLLVMLGAQISKLTNSGGPLGAAAQIVRQFVIDGDERVAPQAIEQSDAQPATTISSFMQGLRLKRPIDPTSRLNLIGLLVALAIILPLLLTISILFNQMLGMPVSGIVGALLALEALLVVLLVRRSKRGILVQADELGARWSKWRKGHHQEDVLFWSEARAFFTFTIQRKGIKASPHRIFAIASSTALLAWEGPPGAHAQQQEGHEWFCSLIARQTKLPLRDVSACLEVAQAKSFSALPSKWLTSPLTFIQVPKPRRTRWQLAQVGIIFIPILLCMLSYGISWGLQHYESYHYEQMLAHIETQFPLYHDLLSAPDGSWPVQPPSDKDKSSFLYSNGEYQVSVGPDDYGWLVWPGITTINAAVEVTARVLSQDQYQDVGLVLHSKSSKDDYILFVVNAAGDWHITHDRQGNEDGWLRSYDQSSDITHRGTGAANRLAVIMQGDQYICFINGHLVGIFHDASAPNGLVGLYVGGAKTIGAFSNFIAYLI